MKKITFIAVLFFAANGLFAQAQKQISFGIVGASWEIPVHQDITIAPTAYTNWDFNHLTLGVKGNYYFDRLLDLPSPWDVYGGANVGFGIALSDGNTSELNLGLQVGGRWFWSEKWGVYLEFGGGKLGGQAGLGLTMKL
ncbi:MAG: hypothetical protein KAH10_00340 [Flavobacteriales bacterium]|nr:hypothetical protein [Flavobacteriales bacterium]